MFVVIKQYAVVRRVVSVICVTILSGGGSAVWDILHEIYLITSDNAANRDPAFTEVCISLNI
tara:strand:- start:175 stop:360 length:186 start_codon:yes stop_codon:yes gene_type:complete